MIVLLVLFIIVVVAWKTYPRLPSSEHWHFNQKPYIEIPSQLQTLRPISAVQSPPLPYTIVIGAAVYNCAPYLDAVFRNIQEIIGLFSDYRILLAYDEGTDETLEGLEKWKAHLPNITILTGRKSSACRTTNLKHARNRLLNEMRQLPPFPYFIMMDFDDVCSEPIRINLLQHVLRQNDRWDALSFPGINSYYDIWALSCTPFLLSYLHFNNPNRALVCAKNFILRELAKEEWVPVYSAFGGFAIYKSDPFLRCSYDNSFQRNLDFLSPEMIKANEAAIVSRVLPSWKRSLREKLSGDCEHRFFHFTATFTHKARMFIVPDAMFAYRDPV